MYIPRTRTAPRQGIILIVVLVILTLFAIVGITFVLYSESAALAARISKDAMSYVPPDMDPEEALDLFLGQLIYDVSDSDPNGVISGLRGYSLARNMYGLNLSSLYAGSNPVTLANITPYNGIGRLHFVYKSAIDPRVVPINNIDEWQLINYTYFSADGFLRDPEYYGVRTSPSVNPNPTGQYIGGANPSYTYPDLNNLYLGVVRATDGLVLARSFHRDYTGFGPFYSYTFNAGTSLWSGTVNPNFSVTSLASNTAQASLKYMTLRPRPADNPDPTLSGTAAIGGPLGFPYPEDAGGDVKNIVTSPGYLDPQSGHIVNNDSFWIDIGAPILTAPDGRKYKALFAPFIMDLDGRVNLNAAGNIRGTSTSPHLSNQGWGPWEINPYQVFNNIPSPPADPSWVDLFSGRGKAPTTTGPYLWGKYGPGQTPAWNGTIASPGRGTHYYGQVDFDGCQTYAGLSAGVGTGTLSGAFQKSPSTAGMPNTLGLNPFPTYPAGYENGTTTSGAFTERTDHPLLFDVYNPNTGAGGGGVNRNFSAANLELLLRFGDTGFQNLTSDLIRLTPPNLNAVGDGLTQNANTWRNRWLFTTHSNDLITPGFTPYIFDVNSPNDITYGLQMNTTDAYTAPAGASIPYVNQATSPTFTFNTAPTVPPAPIAKQPGEYATDYRASKAFNWPYGSTTALLQTVLSRINLNRTLTPYFPGPGTQVNSPNTDPNYYNQLNAYTQYQQALQDRQQFADDIYRRMLLVTGVPPVASPGNPTNAELSVRRYLAQIAVNIVDYIDEDDIITPFNFYNGKDDTTFGNAGGPQLGDNDPSQPADTNAAVDTQYAHGVPLYWVFGTEIPHVTLNEVSAQCQDAINGDNTAIAGAGPPWTVAVWAELRNNFTPTLAQTTQAPGQPQDSFPVELFTATGGASPSGQAPYQIVIAGGMYNPSPATGATASNSNVLGQYLYFKNMTQTTSLATTTDFVTTGGAPVTASKWNTTANGGITTQTSPPYTSPFIDPAQPFFVIAPTASAVSSTSYFADPVSTNATTTAANTPFLRSPHMFYAPVGTGGTFTNGTTTTNPPDERGTGLTILLRRLANPHMPFQPNPAGSANPADYNPYVTVDYFDQVPIFGQNIDGTTPVLWASRGKTQSFAGYTQLASTQPYPNSPVESVNSNSPTQNESAAADAGLQVPPGTGLGLAHTFGGSNTPVPVGNNYTWLPHLDRQVVSPIELLNVSAYAPHYLTNKFIQPLIITYKPPHHLVPWLDANPSPPANTSYRLYRLFEFLDTNNRGAGVAPGGRIAGKININSIWDVDPFYALCDANAANWVSANSDVNAIFASFMANNTIPNARSPMTPPNYTTPSNSPGLPRDYDSSTFVAPNPLGLATAPGAISSVYTGVNPDRPFRSLATGYYTEASMSGLQFPSSRGIEDTLLRSRTVSGHTGRMIEKSSDYSGATVVHPYIQFQLLNKIFNNVTTRSNVFAVWLTVGFFEVTNATTTPPQLGAEVARAEGRNVRHRMFAIIDRTNLAAFQTTVGSGGITTTGTATSINLSGMAPSSYTLIDSRTGRTLNLMPSGTLISGLQLVYDPGTDKEEIVTVTNSSGTLQGTFVNTHLQGATVIIRGNPGPWTRYDVRQDPSVVLHWNVIN
jgi:hypothetical protein